MPSKRGALKLKIPAPRFHNTLDLLKLSIKTFWNNLWFISKVTFCFTIPLKTVKYLLIPGAYTKFYAGFRYDLLVNSVFDALLIPMLIYGISWNLSKRRHPPLLQAYEFGFSQWSSVWVKYFKASFIIWFGFFLFVIPGVVLNVCYSLIAPVVCFEGILGKEPIRRSRQLSMGNRGLLLGSGLALFGFATLISGTLGSLVELPFDAMGAKLIGHLLSDSVTQIAFNLLTVSTLLVYLKARKEKKRKFREWWFIRWAL